MQNCAGRYWESLTYDQRDAGCGLEEGAGNNEADAAVAGQKLQARPAHIAYLENDQRRPSFALLARIAAVLGLDRESLFLLAHPEAESLIMSRRPTLRKTSAKQAWRDFSSDKPLLARHGVKPRELKVLAQVNMLGKVTKPRQYLFILNAIRAAVEEE